MRLYEHDNMSFDDFLKSINVNVNVMLKTKKQLKLFIKVRKVRVLQRHPVINRNFLLLINLYL